MEWRTIDYANDTLQPSTPRPKKCKQYPDLSDIDIDSEYEKIQHKESKLTKAERERIVLLYHRKHEKYERSG